MKQVIFCVDQADLKDLIKVNFIHTDAVSPIITESYEDVISLVELANNIEVVVTKEELNGVDISQEFCDYFLKNQRNTTLIIIGKNGKAKNNFLHYTIENISKLFREIHERYGTTWDEIAFKIENGISMPSHLFLHFQALPFDTYLRLTSNESDRLIKCFHANEPINHEMIKKYIKRGIEDLYIKKVHLKDFSKLLIDHLESRLIEEGHQTQSLNRDEEVFFSLKEIINGFGLKPPLLKLCNFKVRNIMSKVSTLGYFKDFLKEIHQRPDLSYHFCFIYLSSYFSLQYIESMQWSQSQKEAQMEKLIYSSFFSDINMISTRCMRARRPEDLHCMNNEEIQKVNAHAVENARFFSDNTNYPADIERIILQHHGSLNGMEINHYPRPGVVLLAQILFFSQDLAIRILKTKSLELALSSFEENFKEYMNGDVITKFLKSCKA